MLKRSNQERNDELFKYFVYKIYNFQFIVVIYEGNMFILVFRIEIIVFIKQILFFVNNIFSVLNNLILSLKLITNSIIKVLKIWNFLINKKN